jgi:hypothetical protein
VASVAQFLFHRKMLLTVQSRSMPQIDRAIERLGPHLGGGNGLDQFLFGPDQIYPGGTQNESQVLGFSAAVFLFWALHTNGRKMGHVISVMDEIHALL